MYPDICQPALRSGQESMVLYDVAWKLNTLIAVAVENGFQFLKKF